MRRSFGVLAMVCLGAPGAWAQGAKVIDVRAARPLTANSFEVLYGVYKKAADRGDAEGAQAALREIRRLRVERNIPSLDPLTLALVGEGLASLAKGETGRAEEVFRNALAFGPSLPDAHFGMGLTHLRRGPLGFLPAFRSALAGVVARLSTLEGRHHLAALLIPVTLVALFVASGILAGALLVRHGGLLVHDLEEALGPVYGRPGALVLFALVLLLPLLLLQGWGWLPLWWLALLLPYMTTAERVVLLLPVAFCLGTGPALDSLERRLLTLDNPLFRAGLVSVEGSSDPRALQMLEGGVKEMSDDRDLVLLLAVQYKKAGRYDDAAVMYQSLLAKAVSDAVALNNLGNLAFASGEFQAAIARYKQGIEVAPAAEVLATLYYNMQLAHLQKFEYQPAQEARSQADRLAAGLVRSYESVWKYDKGDYAVVDLGLDSEELWAKFEGTRAGVARKNVAGLERPASNPFRLGSLLNPFTGFLLIAAVVVAGLRAWRGQRMFTTACVKCGTPFCKRCHLGAAAAGLCTQCHHLFVVRDGVSGPARNQKLLEVQKEDAKREWIFRGLSLLLPGAGHLYARKTIGGALLALAWSSILTLALLTGRVLPLTDASAAVNRPWGLGILGLLLLVVYVLANRARPDFDVPLLVGRGAVRRGRAA